MRKAYLAAPYRKWATDVPGRVYGVMEEQRKMGDLEALEAVLASRGFDVCVPHRDEGNWGVVYLDPAVVTRRCFDRIRAADLVVAVPGDSRGVHVELGYAAALGKRLVIFLSESERESTLLPGVMSVAPSVVHRYQDWDDIAPTLDVVLEELDGRASLRDSREQGVTSGDVVGLIDIGSNTTKLIVARVNNGTTDILLRELRSESRLAENLYPTRILAQAAIERTAKIVAELRDRAQSNGARQIRAVSTGAAREALNALEFVKRCNEVAELDVDILSAQEEAETLHRGVLSDFDGEEDTFLVLNVGGVSTEITIGSKRTVSETVNLRFGALSLTERFLKSDPVKPGEVAGLRRHVTQALRRFAPPVPDFSPIMVHTGGELDYLMATGCLLWPSSLSASHPVQTDLPAFTSFCRRMRRLSLSELREFMPANPRWMDGAIATNELTLAIGQHFGIRSIVPSNKNLADGLLLGIDSSQPRGNVRAL